MVDRSSPLQTSAARGAHEMTVLVSFLARETGFLRLNQLLTQLGMGVAQFSLG
jgi:hypothetical protein